MQKCVAGKLGQKVALNLLAAFALLFGFFMTKFQFENAQSEREETHNERNKQYNEAHLVASLKQLQIEEDIPMYTKRITRRKTKAVAGTAGALWHERTNVNNALHLQLHFGSEARVRGVKSLTNYA